jgi:lipoate synthase
MEKKARHNEWLSKPTPASVQLFKAKERMSELSLESAIASAKASNLQERLREAEAEVMALEREVELERAALAGP